MDQRENQNQNQNQSITNDRVADCVPSGSADASRRRFLKMAAVSGAALPFCVSMSQAGPVSRGSFNMKAPRAKRIPPRWDIEAARVEQTFTDGYTVPFHRYLALGSTATSGSVPVLTGTAGDLVRMRVKNSLSYAIRPKIVGSNPGPWIAPGSTSTFTIVVPPAGTWMLTDDALGDAAGPMGLGAVIVSRPGGALRKIPNYDREYVLLYVDTDDRWNNAIDTGSTPNLALYEPNYHTLNSLTYPDTTLDTETTIHCQVGERVLLRMCNLGWMRHSIHFHGYHVDIERVNNQPQTVLGPKDTVPLPGHSTMEALLTVDQPGAFPFHPHSLTATTDNGLYAGGQISLIVAT